ncbi:MAG: ABC transporter permease subunit [Pyrinomonadaceae bacterium]|nr:ABC transporter permease subunit [Pyrinomonadaceae bacterium]MCX7638955.1 ABC transporter permease subunit [Pyrinomonadaceae bacterium]MDW8304908.1 ABC transporter permease subunit [Acidobacteriota bacterium]
MLYFIVRRLLIIIPTALLVVTVTWALIRFAPGNFYTGEKQLPAAIEENIRKKYGLDKPWYQQYLIMIGNIIRGDFGESLKYQGQSVNEIIYRHLPYSATIGILAYLLALAVGLTTGILAALRQNSFLDYTSMAIAMLGISIPNFVLGPILVILFALGLYVLPPARWGGLSNLVLPVVTLSAIYAAYIARLTRAGMLEILRSDFIRTARAKGLDEWTVLLRHALRGGIIPVVSFTGPALAHLLAGTVVVEKIFAIPGLGNIFVQSVLNRDEPLILGIVAFLSILIMFFNLIVDISYGFLDPRIRYE